MRKLESISTLLRHQYLGLYGLKITTAMTCPIPGILEQIMDDHDGLQGEMIL